LDQVVEVRACSHGRGAFALKRFEKGQIIAELTNQRFARATTSRGYALRIEENLYWDEEPIASLQTWARYLDHGPKPNVHLSFRPEKRIVVVMASKTIDKGDELLINYADYYPVNYPSNPWSIESLTES
jgi:SET domain-containing protein